MQIFRKALATALVCAAVVLSGPSANAQVAFSTPGLFNVLGEGATPAEREAPTPPITVTPQPPVSPGGTEEPVAPPADVVTPPPPPPDNVVTPPPPPPPPPADPELAIYIAVGGATTGPFDAAQLRQKVSSGELTPETFVWMEGMTEWKPAKEVPQLQPILASAPPPPPADPAFDAVAYLTGTWQSDPEPMEITGAERATIEGTVEYRRDKTYEGFGSIEMVSQGFTNRLNFTMKGTYSLQNVSEQGFVLTLKGSATYFLNTGPFVENVGGAFEMRIVDQNTLVNGEGIRSRRLR